MEEERIKAIMNQFNYNYIDILNQLRIMGDAMVLLNPAKKSNL